MTLVDVLAVVEVQFAQAPVAQLTGVLAAGHVDECNRLAARVEAYAVGGGVAVVLQRRMSAAAVG